MYSTEPARPPANTITSTKQTTTMEYYLEFCSDDDNMVIEDLAPLAPREPLCRTLRQSDSACSLQLSDLEDLHYAEKRSSNVQVNANTGGMWQAINKRSSVHEGERPAKRSKGSFVAQDNSQTNMILRVVNQWAVMNTANNQSFQSTRSAPQRPLPSPADVKSGPCVRRPG